MLARTVIIDSMIPDATRQANTQYLSLPIPYKCYPVFCQNSHFLGICNVAGGGAKIFRATATPAFGKSDFTYEKGGLKPGKSASEFGNSGLKVGKSGPEFGNSDLEFGKSDSEFGNSGLKVGKSGSEFGNSDLKFGNSSSKVGNSESGLGKSNFACGKARLADGKIDFTFGKGISKSGDFGFHRGGYHFAVGKAAAEKYFQFFEGGSTMSKTTDWRPADRKNQITMAKNWLAVLNEEVEEGGGGVKKYAAWGVPESAVKELGFCVSEAMSCLEAAENEETRTKPVNTACAVAFSGLGDAMRDMKRRHFFIPPLTEAEYVALGFRQPDRTHSVTGEPTAQVIAEIFLTTGRHELGVIARYVKGSPDDKANKGYLYWYKVVAPGEAPPESPEELTKLFSTKRKRDVIEFDFEDSGKTVYIAVRVDNNGKMGPWGPMVSALIP